MQSMVNGRSFARQNHRFAHGSWRSKRLYPSARACEFWIFFIILLYAVNVAENEKWLMW